MKQGLGQQESSSVFTTPSPVSEQEDDQTYFKLCARISNRVQWVDDLVQELNRCLYENQSNVLNTSKRIRVLHDVAASIRADLTQLQIIIFRSTSLSPEERSRRVSQYHTLSTQLQQRLQRVAVLIQTQEQTQPTLKVQQSSSTCLTSDQLRRPDYYNLTKSSPPVSGGEEPTLNTGSVFVKMPVDDDELQRSYCPAAMYRTVQSDLEGIQKLAKFFADEVHCAGEDLSAIESNLRETLLNTTNATREVQKAYDIQAKHRQNIATFIVVPSIIFAVCLMIHNLGILPW